MANIPQGIAKMNSPTRPTSNPMIAMIGVGLLVTGGAWPV